MARSPTKNAIVRLFQRGGKAITRAAALRDLLRLRSAKASLGRSNTGSIAVDFAQGGDGRFLRADG